MANYNGPDNIYWLFSSSAQAIAAFIGFLAAGFFFSYDRIDKQVDKDETLEEIYVDIKRQYYKRIKTLFILTGLSIILSLATVWLNGYDLDFAGIIIQSVVAALNVATIVWAILFVVFIIDPEKVSKTATKLIKQNEDLFSTSSGRVLSRGEFIDKFIELEKVLRAIAEKHDITATDNFRFRNFLPLGELIRILFRREIITKHQLVLLTEVNKARNLAAHGEISQIDPKLGEMVDGLTHNLKTMLSED